MSRIVAVHKVLAPHRYCQRDITEQVRSSLPRANQPLLDRLHAAAGVRFRHTVLPLDAYAELDGFGAANDAFIGAAVRMGAEAVGGARASAGLAPGSVDLIAVVSTTGLAAPSVDARL